MADTGRELLRDAAERAADDPAAGDGSVGDTGAFPFDPDTVDIADS